MSDFKFGTLERIAVRKAWKHEAQDFTPWLADNLGLLAKELGIDLELEKTEMQIGAYRADIVARTHDDSRVLIENQLEPANLQHLGQILAYMAGLDAHIVVWVATGFNDIHRSAIRWLNEHTVDPFAFFAVEASVVQIGDSDLAPVFKILERPNEWERQVQDASSHGELSEIGKFRREFWAHFEKRVPNAPKLGPGYAGSHVWIRVEEAGISIVQFLSRDRVGVYLVGNWGESRQDSAPRIEPYVEAIRKSLDKSDEFYTSKHSLCGAQLRIDDSHDHANWDQMVDWLDDHRRRFEKVIRDALPQQ